MSVEDEILVYDAVEVSSSGEIKSYDDAVFENVIRRREIEIIKQVLEAKRPRLILDYGCGGGWLSSLLLNWGFDVVGVDLSKNLLEIAKRLCGEADFVLCDAMRLPFRNGVFDFTIGISILHHLGLKNALNELKRISSSRSTLLFMEPNSLNPFSAFGRKFFPMEAHTKGEKTFTFGFLKTMFTLTGFNVENYFAMFFVSFPIARFLKIAKVKFPLGLAKILSLFEVFMEKIPGLRYLNSTIVALVSLQ